AQRFLKDALAHGPKQVSGVEDAAERAHIDEHTLGQARGDLGVVVSRGNAGGVQAVQWSLQGTPHVARALQSVQEHVMRKVLRGYAKVKDGNLILIGTIPVPHSKDKPSPRERENKRHLVRQGATIFKKETR